MKIVSPMAIVTAVLLTALLVGCSSGPGKAPDEEMPDEMPTDEMPTDEMLLANLLGTWGAEVTNPTTTLTTSLTLVINSDLSFALTTNTPQAPTPPMMREFSGTVEATATMITATITGLSLDGMALTGPALQGALAQVGGATHEFTYSVDNAADPATITVMGDLLTTLGLPEGTLIATKA